MSNILVSVSCLTYNHADYIAECLEGLVKQETNFAYEIVIHDDASTDKTAEIIKTYQENYPNLLFPIYQKENQFSKKIKPTWEFNAPRWRGKYIAFCEGDDYWSDRKKLQKQFDFLEANPNINVCFHKSRIIEGNSIRDYGMPLEFVSNQFSYIELLKHGNFIATASLFIRNSDSLKLPKWFFKITFGDLALLKLITSKDDLYCLNNTMASYRIHSGGVWSRMNQVSALTNYLHFYNHIYPICDRLERKIIRGKYISKLKLLFRLSKYQVFKYGLNFFKMTFTQ